jgi:exosortase
MNRIALFIAPLFATLAWLFVSWPALRSLHTRWIDVGDSYVLGYPLLVVAVWWGYMHRERLRRLPLSPSWWGVILFALTVAITMAGRLIQLQIVQQLMVPASLWFTVAALFGWRMARAVLLPVALQYFGMPVWDFLIEILRTITVVVTQTLLSLVHVPALIENNHIQLQAGIVTVADSCSGLNLLLAALLTGILQAEIGLRGTRRRLLLIGIAGAIGLLVNWIRVFSLVMIAHLSNMQSPLVYSHASFGWWVYAVSLIPFFLIARRLERGERPESEHFDRQRSTAIPVNSVIAAAALILLVLGGEFAAASLMHRVGSMNSGFAIDGNAEPTAPTFRPNYSGFDVEQAWTLKGSLATYELLALTYLREEKEKKLIYYRNEIADVDRMHSTARIATRAGVPLNFSLVSGSNWHLVWWYYWVDGSITASPTKAKLLQLKAMLLGDPTAALVTLSRSCISAGCQTELEEVDGDEANEMLKRAVRLRAQR